MTFHISPSHIPYMGEVRYAICCAMLCSSLKWQGFLPTLNQPLMVVFFLNRNSCDLPKARGILHAAIFLTHSPLLEPRKDSFCSTLSCRPFLPSYLLTLSESLSLLEDFKDSFQQTFYILSFLPIFTSFKQCCLRMTAINNVKTVLV